jgi:hypothetical protein
MISQISSQRCRAGSGCGQTQAGTAETDSSWTELMLAGAFAEPPYGEDGGLRLLPAGHHLVVQVDHFQALRVAITCSSVYGGNDRALTEIIWMFTLPRPARRRNSLAS